MILDKRMMMKPQNVTEKWVDLYGGAVKYMGMCGDEAI